MGLALTGVAVLTPIALTEMAVRRGARTLRAMGDKGRTQGDNSVDGLRFRVMISHDDEAARLLCKHFDVTDIEEAVKTCAEGHDPEYLPGAFDTIADGLNAYLSSKERKEVHA